ncbi:MAG: 3'-5' exonuclease domain-containing protein 2 [Spirochaetaceae bacterium]|nr:3'-5' exonuclease domain-containing protein 2 [Spirochaetaceae bacterium]
MTESQHLGSGPRNGGVLSKDAINQLPVGGFRGRIEVVEGTSAAAACDALRAGAARDGAPVLGFDTESRPAFKRGERHPIALVQLATADFACLFRIDPQSGPPPALRDLLASRDVIKVAQGPADEVRELRDRWRVEARRVLDLVPIARAAGCSPLSLRALAAAYLAIRISKGAQTSNWAAPRLSERQRRYAATDAWACREIFLAMGAPPAAEVRVADEQRSARGARRRPPRRRGASVAGVERRAGGRVRGETRRTDSAAADGSVSGRALPAHTRTR